MFFVVPLTSVSNSLSPKMTKRIIGWILLTIAVICFLVGLIAVYDVKKDDNEIYLMEETSRDNIKPGNYYRIQDLCIFDCFATKDNDYFCLCAFYDGLGRLCIAPIEVDSYSTIYRDTTKYLEGESYDFAEYYTDAYVFTENDTVDDKLRKYQQEWVEYYVENGVFEEDDLIPLTLCVSLDHKKSIDEAKEELHRNDIFVAYVFFIGFAVTGIIGGILFLRNRGNEMEFEKVFNLGNEKDVQKVYQALANGRGREFLDEFLTESKSANALNLESVALMITNRFLCDYSGFKKTLFIIPTEDIINVYYSNCFYGKYVFDRRAIAVETKNNETFYVASRLLNKKAANEANQAYNELIKRCKSNEGSLIA